MTHMRSHGRRLGPDSEASKTKEAWRSGTLAAPKDVLRVFNDTPLVRVWSKRGEHLKKAREADEVEG
jgi:hypothetical protein